MTKRTAKKQLLSIIKQNISQDQALRPTRKKLLILRKTLMLLHATNKQIERINAVSKQYRSGGAYAIGDNSLCVREREMEV